MDFNEVKLQEDFERLQEDLVKETGTAMRIRT
jgi:hypothetical protein